MRISMKLALSKFFVLGFGALALAFGCLEARAEGGLLQDFDSLGGNNVLLEKAKALNPDTKVQVVQDRIVNRRMRLEIAPEYSSVLGGDPYNHTQNVGGNLHFHFTPQFSLGLKYNYSFNQLRPEGESLINDRELTKDGPIIPDIDYMKSQYMAVLNWYPIYGKMNLYDLGVAHFDIYALVGGGQVELKSGRTPTYTAGGGVGFWISQHLTARAELRYQGYKARRYDAQEVEMNTSVLSLQIGYLL